MSSTRGFAAWRICEMAERAQSVLEERFVRLMDEWSRDMKERKAKHDALPWFLRWLHDYEPGLRETIETAEAQSAANRAVSRAARLHKLAAAQGAGTIYLTAEDYSFLSEYQETPND